MSRAPQSLHSEMQGLLRQHRPVSADVADLFDPAEVEKERRLRIRLLALGVATVLAFLVLAFAS